MSLKSAFQMLVCFIYILFLKQVGGKVHFGSFRLDQGQLKHLDILEVPGLDLYDNTNQPHYFKLAS